jgi:hypothetical protein
MAAKADVFPSTGPFLCLLETDLPGTKLQFKKRNVLQGFKIYQNWWVLR